MSRFQPERWLFFPIRSAERFKVPFTDPLTTILVTYRNGFYYIGNYTMLFKAAWERLGFVFLGRQLIYELIEQRNKYKQEKYNYRLRYHTYNTILYAKSCTDLLSLILRDSYQLQVRNPQTDLTKETFREKLLRKIENRKIAMQIKNATPWLKELYNMRVIIAHREALPLPFYLGEPPAREKPFMSNRPIKWIELIQIVTDSKKLTAVSIQDFLKRYSDELTNLFQSVAEDFISLKQNESVKVINNLKIPKEMIEFKGMDADVFKLRAHREFKKGRRVSQRDTQHT